MWPLPQINKHLITISFDPQHIVCGLIKPATTCSEYELYAYKKIYFSCNETNRPYSSTVIQEIKSFLSAYNLHNAFACFSIKNLAITQMLITSNTAQPNIALLRKERHLEKAIGHTTYLYTTPEGLFTFYLAALERELLFNYQLLALQLRLHLLTIAPSFQTILTVYKHIHGSAFRQVQLASDMAYLQNKLDAFCTLPIFNRILKTTHISAERSLLIPLIGLYLAEKG